MLKTGQASGSLPEAIRIKAIINISNCTAHTAPIQLLERFKGAIPRTYVLSKSDSSVAGLVLAKLGVSLCALDSISFLAGPALTGNLLDGMKSRVQVLLNDRKVLDFDLDNLQEHVPVISLLKARSVHSSSFPIHGTLNFSSSCRYAATSGGLWILDEFLNNVHFIRLDTATSSCQAAIVRDFGLEYDNLCRITLLPMLDSAARPAQSDLVDIDWIQSETKISDAIVVIGNVKTSVTVDSYRKTRPYDNRLVIITLTEDSLIEARVVQRPKLEEESPILNNMTSSGFIEMRDTLTAQVMRFGRADMYPLFAKYYRSETGEMSMVSFPPLPYPDILWDHGFQYQMTNGHFAKGAFAFSIFPLIINTLDWKLHDVSDALNVNLDSALAEVPFNYHCKALFQEKGILSLLHYAQGSMRLARFTYPDMEFLFNVDIDYTGWDPISVTLLNHDTMWALTPDRRRMGLLRIR